MTEIIECIIFVHYEFCDVHFKFLYWQNNYWNLKANCMVYKQGHNYVIWHWTGAYDHSMADGTF